MRSGAKSPGLAWAAMMLAGCASVAQPLAHAAPAGAPAGVESPESLRARYESKSRLVRLLLAQSPAVQRIPKSGNAQARKLLDDARGMADEADAEAQGGRTEPAIRLLDQALLNLTSASRLVPDPAQAAAQERTRYAGLSEAVRVFLNLQRNVAARDTSGKARPIDTARINALVERAESLAAAGKHQEANRLLDEVYAEAVGSISQALMSETVVYDRSFATPADEFQHELARNRSYEELIPIALSQLNPPRETVLLAEQYAQTSRELRATAQQQAAGGDYSSAVKTILDATGHLQRSLRLAGVVVPQSIESKP